jgi:EAL domain-containing protein (putative c-di-GMP-specific phosphodiesterase class I)
MTDAGCEKIQGYLIARPLDEEAAIDLVQKQSDSGPKNG